MFKKTNLCPPIGACVEVNIKEDVVIVRNSRKPEVIIEYTKEEWSVFIEGVKGGEFDV